MRMSKCDPYMCQKKGEIIKEREVNVDDRVTDVAAETGFLICF